MGAPGSSSEALYPDEVASRQEQAGAHTAGDDEPPRPWAILLRQFASPLSWILLVAAVVTVAIGEHIDTA